MIKYLYSTVYFEVYMRHRCMARHQCYSSLGLTVLCIHRVSIQNSICCICIHLCYHENVFSRVVPQPSPTHYSAFMYCSRCVTRLKMNQAAIPLGKSINNSPCMIDTIGLKGEHTASKHDHVPQFTICSLNLLAYKGWNHFRLIVSVSTSIDSICQVYYCLSLFCPIVCCQLVISNP